MYHSPTKQCYPLLHASEYGVSLLLCSIVVHLLIAYYALAEVSRIRPSSTCHGTRAAQHVRIGNHPLLVQLCNSTGRRPNQCRMVTIPVACCGDPIDEPRILLAVGACTRAALTVSRPPLLPVPHTHIPSFCLNLDVFICLSLIV